MVEKELLNSVSVISPRRPIIVISYHVAIVFDNVVLKQSAQLAIDDCLAVRGLSKICDRVYILLHHIDYRRLFDINLDKLVEWEMQNFNIRFSKIFSWIGCQLILI